MNQLYIVPLPRTTRALYARKRVKIGGLTHLSRQGILSAWNMNAMRLGRESRSRRPRYCIMLKQKKPIRAVNK